MRIRHDESGQVLVLAALCLTALLGFVALATDVGLLFRAKRNLQIAADAAASAGALDYLYNASNSTAQTAANAAAARNGETNGSGGAVVTVNIPPQNGYHTTTGYVEVIITQANPTFFMNIFNINSVTVAARAVAGSPSPSSECVYVMDPSASGAMKLQGAFTVTAPNCGVEINSSDPNALDFIGAAGSLTAGSVGVVGGESKFYTDSSPLPVTGIAPFSDPLKITGPNPSTDCTVLEPNSSYTASLPGGVVCFTNKSGVTLSNIALGSGTYVFEYGATLTAVTGTGVTLDDYSGPLSVTTNELSTLSAPASTSLTGYASGINGVVLLVPASNSTTITIQKGSSNAALTGIIYAPTSELFLNDNGGGASMTTDLIVGTLYDKASSLSITNYSAANPTTTPLKAVSLVE